VTPADRSEHGSTLIEVLISVVILSLAITAFLFGMSTTVGTSSISRDQANVEAMLTSAGAVFQDNNLTQYSCDVNSYNNGLQAHFNTPWWMIRVGSLQYWNPGLAPPLGGWQSACTGSLLQDVRITVQSQDRQVTMFREFVKRPSP
jgi:type II secretory pathway pseudopilin PulG